MCSKIHLPIMSFCIYFENSQTFSTVHMSPDSTHQSSVRGVYSKFNYRGDCWKYFAFHFYHRIHFELVNVLCSVKRNKSINYCTCSAIYENKSVLRLYDRLLNTTFICWCGFFNLISQAENDLKISQWLLFGVYVISIGWNIVSDTTFQK